MCHSYAAYNRKKHVSSDTNVNTELYLAPKEVNKFIKALQNVYDRLATFLEMKFGIKSIHPRKDNIEEPPINYFS